jgi:ABC-type nickel/cobalt efflux system permease component RcnA
MSQEELIAQIEKLQKEIKQLKGQTVFSDVQPYIEENERKFKKVIISGIGLQYLIRYGKKDILRLIHERVADDLMQEIDNVQFLHPVEGTLLRGDEDIELFRREDEYHLDFQYANACNHDHDHDDDFSDDESFYNSCSCSHQH